MRKPLQHPGLGELLQVGARLAQAVAAALGLAHHEAPADQVVEGEAARHDVAAGLPRPQFDAVLARERLDRLGLDQRDVPARLAILGERPAAREVAVALEPAAGDRGGLGDALGGRLGDLRT